MLVLDIDPGPKSMGVALWDAKAEKILFTKEVSSDDVMRGIRDVGMEHIPYNILLHEGTQYHDHDCFLAIERIRGYGMVSGNETFDTCEFIGAMAEAGRDSFKKVFKVPRKTVTSQLTGSPKAGDKDVRAYLIDRLGEVGTKKNPGPLYGVVNHMWPALAVAICVGDAWKLTERNKKKQKK